MPTNTVCDHRRMETRARRRDLGSEVVALLLAATCAGCDERGTLLCDRCRTALAAAPVTLRTPGGLRVRAALSFDAVAARCIRRLKGSGETLLAHPLGSALAEVLQPELRGGARAVPVPTSRASFRQRGYRVPDVLIRRAGAAPWCILRAVGRRSDQRGLGARERRDNVRGAVRARRGGEGESVALVDDVVTTGATLDEAARTLREAGFSVTCAVVLAATPRRDRR